MIGPRVGAEQAEEEVHHPVVVIALPPRSVVATGTFLVTAIVTVFVMRHVVGG